MLAHSSSPWVGASEKDPVLKPVSDADWGAIANAYPTADPRPPVAPLQRVLAVARESGCKSIVVETRYIDLDFRSEHAAFWAQRFEVPSAFARRLHFFAADLDPSGLHDLPEECGYLGYAVIRPVDRGRVGRTVLKAPPRLQGAVLTTVSERVSLYGNDLEVIGVPFCEQDAEYLRCAHAAAWICHYTAVRRNLVGRQPTSKRVELSPAALSTHRVLPSQGLTLNQLQAVFGSLGQPALHYGFKSLPKVSGVKHDDHVRCVSIICRYLNSGFPVLVAGEGHAWVLVGWKREVDGSVTFIACDDQVGPYEEIPTLEQHYRWPWGSIMVPLPPRVFLTGEAAENDAFRRLRGVWTKASMPQVADLMLSGAIQLRTRLKNVRAFKREIAEQTSSDDVLRAIRRLRMPNFVWAVEAHVKAACGSGSCVVATVIYDATSPDLHPRVVAIVVPGAIATYPIDEVSPGSIQASAEPWASLLPSH